VIVETLLNIHGNLIWDFKYWGWPHIWSVMLFAYMPSILFLYWLYDLKSLKMKAWITGGLLVIDIVAFVVFGCWFKWI
jgi:hypothetical protein